MLVYLYFCLDIYFSILHVAADLQDTVFKFGVIACQKRQKANFA